MKSGPAGEPSRIDFELYDLVLILEVFATRWEELPEFIRGRPQLLSVSIDTSWPDDPEDDAGTA